MRFSVCHETHYRVFVRLFRVPFNVLRLTPRSDNAVLLTHSLTVDPAPTIRQDVTDRHGNSITLVEFGDPSARLSIESRFELETRVPRRLPPPRCRLCPGLPAQAKRWRTICRRWIRTRASGCSPPGWRAKAARRFSTSSRASIRHCSPEWTATSGPKRAAESAAHTLATGSGACRDLTVLFMGSLPQPWRPGPVRQRIPGARRYP